MANHKTNIEITETAWPFWILLTDRYSAKQIASAGALLLAQLSGDEREETIDIADGRKALPELLAKLLVELAKEVAKVQKQRQGRKPPGPV